MVVLQDFSLWDHVFCLQDPSFSSSKVEEVLPTSENFHLFFLALMADGENFSDALQRSLSLTFSFFFFFTKDTILPYVSAEVQQNLHLFFKN